MKLTPRRKAIGVSLAFHAALLGVLLVWYVPRHRGAVTGAAAQPSSSGGGDQRARQPSGPAPPVPEETAVDADEIQASLDRQLEQVSKLSDERKLSELEKNLKRLDSIARPESVESVTETIAGSLGLDTEKYTRRTNPPSGLGDSASAASESGQGGSDAFEVNSAQIESVSREPDGRGGYRYRAVMLDGEGRTMEVPLGEAEGAKLHETFELMERYPMAKSIYQAVVMPMMQEMLRSAERRPVTPESRGAAADDRIENTEAVSPGGEQGEQPDDSDE